MSLRQFSSPSDQKEYDHWVKSHTQGTLWQSLEWKTYQEALGREVRIYVDEEGIGNQELETRNWNTSALVVIDRTTFGLSTWDIPRGPIGEEKREERKEKESNDSFIDAITEKARQEKAISLFYSPQNNSFLSSLFSLRSRRSEQPPATRLINLTQSEEEILAQMKQKGRYNIRLAEKHGVIVEQSTDINAFARLAAETARRDGFTAPPASRYQKFLQSLPGAFLLLAFQEPGTPNPCLPDRQAEPTPIAGLLGTIWNEKGIYYYGASDYAHRALMAPYLLQWEAMKLSKTKGCTSYDLLGIAAPTNCKLQIAEHTKGRPSAICNLQSSFSTWSGITRFKEQFGGTIVSYPPEQQIVLKLWANKVLAWKRRLVG